MASSRSRRPQARQPSDKGVGGIPPGRDRRMRRPSSPGDRRRLRIALILGGVIFLVVAGIASYGFYDKFVAPNQVLASRVGSVVYTQGDLVDRMRLIQAATEAVGGESLDFTRVPFQVLQDMTGSEIIRQLAPARFRIDVTDEDVDRALRFRFFPRVSEDQEALPGQLEQEFKDNYRMFLSRAHLSSSEYLQIVEEDIYRGKLREELGDRIPSVTEQVEVRWIRIASNFDPGAGASGPTAADISGLLQTESFEDVARQMSRGFVYADNSGYVGWVPRGAFPSLDKYLYGDEERLPLRLGEVSEPAFFQDAHYLIKVTAGPERQQVSEEMRERLKDQSLENWLTDQKRIGAQEGWLEVNFSSELYAWANKQVRKALRGSDQ